MRNYYTLKDFFFEINDYIIETNLLAKEENLSNKWTEFFDEIINSYAPFANSTEDFKSIINKIVNQRKEDISEVLLYLCSGLSIEKPKNRRLCINVIYCLDEIILTNEDDKNWKRYIEFRYKSFKKLIDNNYHAEAATILDNLRLHKESTANSNSTLLRSLKQYIKPYRRLINLKIEGFENQNNYNQAQFLNSIYYVHPEYEFEARLQEREKRYLGMPFFEILFEIIFPIVLLTILFGINIVVKDNTATNIFYFFRIGNFSFVELTVGFFVIYLTFWIFKVLEYSKLTIRQTIFFKIVTIITIILSLQLYVQNKYNKSEKRYFPQKTSHIKPKKNLDDIFVLVTKFNPIEQHSVFDRNYSELKACNAFYKKMLLLKESSVSAFKENIHFDYSNQNLNIDREEDFDKIYTQKKYDFVIIGDVYKTDKANYVTINCCIVNDEIKIMTRNWQDSLPIGINEVNGNPIAYFANPMKYYEKLFKNDVSVHRSFNCANYSMLKGYNFSFNTDFPTAFSINTSIDVAPIIVHQYISLLLLWSKCEKNDMTNQEDYDNLINCINNILAVLLLNDKSKGNINFEIHLKILKAFFVNKKLIHKLPKYQIYKEYIIILDLWIQKTQFIGEALYRMLQINEVQPSDIEYIMKSYWFISYMNGIKYLDIEDEDKDQKVLRVLVNNLLNTNWNDSNEQYSTSKTDIDIYEKMYKIFN